ncbi:MAG TPA: hypothetical protein VFJ85_00615 [Acidimicrobiales bacterium]|nr:hypothetical protein [Acidimicrobiales bacterium]
MSYRVKILCAIGAIITQGWVSQVGPAAAETTVPSSTTTTTRPKFTDVVDVQGNSGENGEVYEVQGFLFSATDGQDALPGRFGRHLPKPGAPVYIARFPALVPDGSGRYCIRPIRRYFDTQEDASAYDDVQQFRWMMLTPEYAVCNLEPVPGVPAVEASDFWRTGGEKLLPKPEPHIAPGYMLAGKRAYLETNSLPTMHVEQDTPLGTLVLDATSTVWVDWGTGSYEGPFDGPGQPWPDGKITHVWTDLARYDIRVQQRWTATWHLAGRSGQLSGLHTEGGIDDFEVKELQAIVNH